MQAGQQRAAPPVDLALAGAAVQARADLGDPRVRDADVDASAPADLDPGQEQLHHLPLRARAGA